MNDEATKQIFDERTVTVGYTTYSTGRLDRKSEGRSLIEVVSSKGSRCEILAVLMPNEKLGKILDIKGDADAFEWWANNVRGK